LVDDIDFELDQATGRLRDLNDGELPDQYKQMGLPYAD
jgi:hypothetical protein